MEEGSETNPAKLKARWRERVREARVDYERAQDAVAKSFAECHGKPLPASDGFLALKQAMLRERVSLNEYMRTLRILCDLVLYDKMPPDD
jgi:hypothetical protein